MVATRKRKSSRTPAKSKKPKAEEDKVEEEIAEEGKVEEEKTEGEDEGEKQPLAAISSIKDEHAAAAAEALNALSKASEPDVEGVAKDDDSPPKDCHDGNCGTDGSDESKAEKEEKDKALPSTGKTAAVETATSKSSAEASAVAAPKPSPKPQPAAPAAVINAAPPAQSGVPSGAPVAVQAEAIVEETGEVSSLYVGRVIGRGGEMIRDLQARSTCRIDVDQNVPQGAPRVITYRGTRSAITFARQLVGKLCTENGKDADLPLGRAIMRKVQVPGNVIGKIIGRGGEMIRKLQSESQAKIQVDHSGAGMDANHRQVTITGTNESVCKAEEMIMFLSANPAVDAMQALHMLIRDKTQGGGVWGSGPPYANLPNQGQGMPDEMGGGYQGGGGYGQMSGGHGGYGQASDNRYGPSGGGGGGGMGGGDVFPCAKTHMGRVIGQKGVTINDLQKRSGCDIQINQNVPAGQDCQITIKGSREGIEMAKQMLHDIIELGSNHPYAGGHGQSDRAQQGGQHGYQQPSYQGGHSSQGHQPQMNSQQQYGMPQQQYGGQPMYQQQQPYQPQPGQYGMQPGSHAPQAQPSPWRAATAADGQVYYYNQITQETQWDRPAGMP